jgi:mRNA interferase MazF
VIWIDLNPVVGHEQAGRRPAVVLSPEAYNDRTGLVLLCPITRSLKGYIFEVPIPRGEPIYGAVLADHARSMDWRLRRAEFAARLSPATVEQVQQSLTKLILQDIP